MHRANVAHKECEWKDGDRGGLAERKQTEREERKVCLDINRPSHGRLYPKNPRTHMMACNVKDEQLHRAHLDFSSHQRRDQRADENLCAVSAKKTRKRGLLGPDTLSQFERFQWLRDQLKQEGFNIPLPTGN